MKQLLKHQRDSHIRRLKHFEAHHDELSEACLKKAELDWGNLMFAKLARRNFEGAALNWVDLQFSDLRGANFKDAKLSWVDLRHAKLDGSIWDGAEVKFVHLSSDNIRHLPAEVIKSSHACTVELPLDDYKALICGESEA